MNVFGNSSKQLLQALTANAENETMDYVLREMQAVLGKRCRKRMRCEPIYKILTSPRNSVQRSGSWPWTSCWSVRRSISVHSAT